MDSKPSLSDVARIAGVAKPTVSIVLNGKGDKGRICPDTQSRIRAVARELGYQKQSTMPVPLPSPVTGAPPKMVGLLLSAASPASTLALIPGRDAIASMKGCRLVVVTLPPDPAAAKARVLSLVQEGFVSFICCPTVYAIVAGGGEVAELPVVELLRVEPVVTMPKPVIPVVVPVVRVVVPEPVIRVAAPEPVVVEKPAPPVIPVPEPVIPVMTPVEPVVVAEPVIPVMVPIEPVVVTEPIVVPEPVVVETEPVIPVAVPVVAVPPATGGEVAELSVVELLREEPVAVPVEPVVVTEPVVVETPTPPPVVAPEMVPIEEISVTLVIEAPVAEPDPAPAVPQPNPVSPVAVELETPVIPQPAVEIQPQPMTQQPNPVDGSEPIPEEPMTMPRTPDTPDQTT